MAAAVPRKGNQQSPGPKPEPQVERNAVASTPLPPEVVKALTKLAQAQASALEKSTWVGDSFAEQSRAMHYGERNAEAIHGRAKPEEAKALLEEGIAVAPLPFPVIPPDERN